MNFGMPPEIELTMVGATPTEDGEIPEGADIPDIIQNHHPTRP